MKALLSSGGSFAEWLGRTSLHASVLIGLVLLAQWVFRRHLSARWRHALWWLVLARLLLPFAPASSLSVWSWIKASVPRLENARAIASAPELRPVAERPAMRIVARLVEEPANPGSGVGSRPASLADGPSEGYVSPTQAARPISWREWLWRGWLAGVIFLGGGLAIRQWRFFRGTRNGEPVRNAATLTLLTGCQQSLGVAAAPVLVVTRAVASPALCGCWRPRLLLPPGLLATLSERELRHVFLHELAHLKRRDIAVNWLLALAQILHWFNPLVWFACRRMRADGELAADELALTHAATGENHAYGRTIIKLLEATGTSTPLPSVVGILEERRELQRRIAMISTFRHASRWPVVAITLLVVLAVTGLTDPPPPPRAIVSVAPKQSAAADLTVVSSFPVESEILFHVLDARTGLPLADAELVVTGCDDRGCRPFGAYRSPAAGPVSLSYPALTTKRLSVRVSHAGFVPKAVNWLEESNEQIPGQYLVKLDPGVTIGGEVRDASGAPVANARVRLEAREGNNPYARETPGWLGSAGYVRTDADGRWRCDFAPADLRLISFRLEHPDFVVTRYTHPGARQDLGPLGNALSGEELLAQKAVWTINSGQVVKGVVAETSGQPIAGARVLLGELSHDEAKITVSDGAGRFEFRNREQRDTVLTIQASGYAPELLRFEGFAREDALNIKLGAGSMVQGRVVDDSGQPLSGVMVSANGNTWRRERTLEWETRTGPDGGFMWDSAPAETFSYKFLKAGHEIVDVNLAPGGTVRPVTLRRLPRLSGTVVDAVSKRLIPVFRVTPGLIIPPNLPGLTRQIVWLSPTRCLNGQYSLAPEHPVQVLQFEAAGYAGATVEDASLAGVSGTNNVELTLAGEWSGIVVTGDGKPVGGAQVAARRPQDDCFVRQGRLEPGHGNIGGSILITGGDGGFAMGARPFATSLVVAHEVAGFAEVTPEALKASRRIVLQPWARVEGVSRTGARAESDVTVMLVDPAEGGLGFSQRWQFIRAQPDADGKFTLDFVPPGRWILARRFRSDPNGGQRIVAHPVDLIPGRVNRVALGGRGRPVVGRASVSGKLGAVTWSRGSHRLASVPPGPGRIPEYPVNFKPDGTFRVEDVEAGAFELRLQLKDSSHHTLATLKRSVTIPPLAGERSDEPLDIGVVELELSPYVMAGGVPVDLE